MYISTDIAIPNPQDFKYRKFKNQIKSNLTKVHIFSIPFVETLKSQTVKKVKILI